MFGYVNHARIRSWNQPELNNERSVLVQGYNGSFDAVRTHDWQVSTDDESGV